MIYVGICIGGPLDGQRKAAGRMDDGGYSLVPIYIDAVSGFELKAWVPEGQNKKATLGRLLEGYRP